VLGFDAGCMKCSDLARRIEERVGDELEVRSLHHPQVEHWRERAFGKDAPWAPTLFEIGGAREVRAWTGARMAVRLARVLGPVSTWRVMQALGEVGATRLAADGSPAAKMGAAGMSRGQFLKGVGGAALAFGTLAGVASPAAARPGRGEVDEEALVEAFTEIQRIPDSVISQGDQAARQYLQARLGALETSRASISSCALAILRAIAENIIPIRKVRALIRAVGGVRKLARIIRIAYEISRDRGASRAEAVRAAARAVIAEAGGEFTDVVFLLVGVDTIIQGCFS
jgi:hypothetical protein